jgi:hypothetical protein
VNGVGHLPDDDGLCVLDLLLSGKGIAFATMSAIRTMTRSGTFDTRTWSDFEVPQALLHRALAPKVAVIIRFNGNAELASEPAKIVHGKRSFLMILKC